MPTAQVVLRDLLKDHVAPALRAAGYAGSGQDFRKRIAGNWAAINVQRSSHDTADELRFTVNIGTASTAVRLEDGHTADDPPREVDCHWRTRIGGLLPGGRDTWWTVRSTTPAEEARALGTTVRDALSERAVPELERRAPDEAILEAALPGGKLGPGILPGQMDVAGPILRRLGPVDRFAAFLQICDRDGARALSMYELLDDYPPPPLGPARLRKRLADVSRAGFERRQQAILDLGWATPTDEVTAALRPLLGDPNPFIRFAAASALGRLGDVHVAPQLQLMVRDEPARSTAVHAAYALMRLDDRLDDEGRAATRQAIRTRRDRAVGHDRAALSELFRRLPAA